MNSAGQVLRELYAVANANDADSQENVRRVLNLAYFDLCKLASFVELRRSVSIAHGSYLPSDLAGVDAVYNSDGEIYHARDKYQVKQLLSDDPVPRWYFDDIVTTPSVYQKGMKINKGATTFETDPAITYANYIGEYMTIGGEPGFYKITAAQTISPQYMGPNLQAPTTFFQIRPEGTKKLKLADEQGDDDASTVTVDYWAYPPAIFDESQRILLPTTKALILTAQRRLVQVDLKDRFQAEAMQRDYETAVSDLLSANPRYVGPAIPRNRNGAIAGWGALGRSTTG